MEMVKVRSSAIRAVGYDHSIRRMRITFEQGHTYDFCEVPPDVHQALMSASSKGTYYNKYIKDRYSCS